MKFTELMLYIVLTLMFISFITNCGGHAGNSLTTILASLGLTSSSNT